MRRALRERCARSSGCRAIGKTELLSREARWPFADTERLISLKIRKFGLSNMCTEIKPCLGELLFPAAALRLPRSRREFNENAFRKQ